MGATICISGVGGGVGQSVIKSLTGKGFELVGMDGEALGTGLYAVPHSYVIPYARDPRFLDSLLAICERHKAALLFPGLDAELPVLAKHADAFSRIGTRVVVSSQEVVAIADDKLLTAQLLARLGLPSPATCTLGEYLAGRGDVPFPCILKPKTGGARSKNVFKLKSRTELERLMAVHELDPQDYVVQEHIDGDEYTCGSVTLDGTYHGCIVMRRILRDGDTYKCFVEANEAAESAVGALCRALKPVGALNVQLRMRDGVPYVFELNARCSGTTAARALAGFNEPLMISRYCIEGIAPKYEIRPLSILRYWKELVVPQELIDSALGTKEIVSRAGLSL